MLWPVDEPMKEWSWSTNDLAIVRKKESQIMWTRILFGMSCPSFSAVSLLV